MTYIRGDVKDPSAKDPPIEKYEAAVRRIEETRNRDIPLVYRLLRALARTMFRMNLEILKHDRMVVPCVAGRRMLTLSDDGVVKPCEVLEAKEGTNRYDFGNVRDHGYDLARLRATPAARESVRWIRESECHCTFECANMANVALAPKMWPRILKETLAPSL
jgi:MoaA/NifB/PqqE/SkfB family radical SAM enzyme